MGRAVESSPAVQRFELLYRAQVRALLGYALRRVDRAEEAADVVAETMLVAWRRLDEVPAGAEARPWLFGVARRVLANNRRSWSRRDRLGERLRSELGQLVGADHAATVATNLVVREAVDGLDADDREILLLTTWEGLRPGEIAVALDLPAATVRTRLHRARQRLRQRLNAEDDDERWSPAGHVEPDERLLVRDAEDER